MPGHQLIVAVGRLLQHQPNQAPLRAAVAIDCHQCRRVGTDQLACSVVEVHPVSYPSSTWDVHMRRSATHLCEAALTEAPYLCGSRLTCEHSQLPRARFTLVGPQIR